MEGGCSTGEVAAQSILKNFGWQIPTQQQPININQRHRYRRIPRKERFSHDLTE